MSVEIWNDVAHCIARELAELDPNRGFVENGGHSLAAIAVSRLLRKKGKTLTVEALLTCSSLTDLLGEAPIQPYINSVGKASMLSSATSSLLSETENIQSESIVSLSAHESYRPRDRSVRANSLTPPKSPTPSSYPAHIRQTRHKRPNLASSRYSTPPRGMSREGRIVSSLDHLPPSISFTDLRSLSQSIHNDHQKVSKHDDSWPMLTEMQLSLLHGSLKVPGSDIIHHSETYLSEYLPVLRLAWQRIMDVEPVFKTQFPEELVGKDQVTFEWIEVVAHSSEDYEGLVQEAFYDTRIGSHFCVVTLAEPGQRSISNIIWSVHHALIDGYSASLLFDKIRQYTTGIPITAGPSFTELAAELHTYQSHHGDEGREFWA